MIHYQDFEKVDIRVGTIIEVEAFLNAKKKALKLVIDFGREIGKKKSSAQICELYSKENLLGKQVLAVVNFPPKQIANFISEVLVLGLEQEGKIVLVAPDEKVSNGKKLF